MNHGHQRRRLGDLLDVQNGYAFDSTRFSSTAGMPLIRIRDLRRGTATETRFDGNYDPKYLVHAGDLLIGMDGDFACYEWRGEPALLNQRVCRLQNFKASLLPRYVFYGISQHLKDIEAVTGFATVKHLSSKSILDIEMPIPPRAEQEQIAGMLDEAFGAIDRARANTERNIRNAADLLDAYVARVFDQRGDGWTERSLGDISVVQSGGTPPVGTRAYWNGDIPWYSSGELNDFTTSDPARRVTPAGMAASSAKLFPAGSLLIGMYDTAALKMSILDRDAAFNQAVAGVGPNADLDLAFVRYAISAKKPQLLLERRGVRQKNLSLAKIKAIAIPCPPVPEQRDVAERIRLVAAETDRLAMIYSAKLLHLEALNQSLLREAFTGAL